MRQDNFYHCLTAFLLITVYTYTARQFCQLSYRVKLLAYASRDGKTIKSIVLPCSETARQSTRLSYRGFKTPRQSYILSYPPPFSSSSLTISYTRTYTHTHSPFSSFDRKTCWFFVSFSSFMLKNLLVWFICP